MDPICARAVREAFFRLFKDGLIYRGKRLVNWDPALQTAVADDECEDIEVDANFYYLRYPLVHAQVAQLSEPSPRVAQLSEPGLRVARLSEPGLSPRPRAAQLSEPGLNPRTSP